MDAQELFHKNMLLARFILNKYFSAVCKSEDLLQAAYIGLWKACVAYDSERGILFATFASNCIKNEIRMELRKWNKSNRISMVSLDEPIIDELTYEGVLEDLHECDFKDVIAFQDVCNSIRFTEREKEVLKTYFHYGNQTEVSKVLGLSQSYVSRILNKAREKVSKKLSEDQG